MSMGAAHLLLQSFTSEIYLKILSQILCYSEIHYLAFCLLGFFKNKVMTAVWIKINSITELHLPSNQFPKTPCPHTLCVPNSFLSE